MDAGHTKATGGSAAEAQLLAHLDHPHIVRVYDYLETDDLRLIVMEFPGGGTLTRQAAGMAPGAACAAGLAIATALSYAHARGVLHRDVKPDNVLFDAAGLLEVTDFGLAKIVEGSAATASRVVGTPPYMAPEQITGTRLGPATDLLCTCQASGCESVGSCWLSVTAFAAGPGAPQNPVGGPRRPLLASRRPCERTRRWYP